MNYREPNRVEYKCPLCNGLYYSSGYVSCNTFGASFYSDGTCWGLMYHTPTFAHKCVYCGRYFLAKYFVELDYQVNELMDRMSVYDALGDTVFENKVLGYYDEGIEEDDYKSYEYMLNNWQLCYHPDDITAEDDKLDKINTYTHLWRAYNNKRNEIDDEKYCKVCQTLLEMINKDDDKQKLLCAELSRNIGDFDKCLEYLSSIINSDEYKKIIQSIEIACKRKIRNTVEINQ